MKAENPKIEQIPALRQLWQEAFGDKDAFLDCFFSTAFSPERCLCICDGERVASALYWLDAAWEGGKGAYIYALATAKTYRGRGYAHSLLSATREKLGQQGYQAAILVPGSAQLERFYLAQGYCCFGGVENFSAVAEKPAAALRNIGPEEYGQLRRSYLPVGGVVQEAESLAFLAGYAQLYAGADFLLAAWREGDTLNGLELLGNTAAAPHILEALGAKQGSFRSPGQRPFAMWLPLAECKTPGYFGLAFD